MARISPAAIVLALAMLMGTALAGIDPFWVGYQGYYQGACVQKVALGTNGKLACSIYQTTVPYNVEIFSASAYDQTKWTRYKTTSTSPENKDLAFPQQYFSGFISHKADKWGNTCVSTSPIGGGNNGIKASYRVSVKTINGVKTYLEDGYAYLTPSASKGGSYCPTDKYPKLFCNAKNKVYSYKCVAYKLY